MGTKNQWRYLALHIKFRHFILHTRTGRSSKILNDCVHGFKLEPVHVKHENAFL